jgi:Double zinc ribbon
MAFCGRCGTKLASLCPACGFANPEGFAFCGKCGARVAEAPALPRQRSTAFASPQSYTPKHLAEKILTSKSALEGAKLYRRTGKRELVQKNLILAGAGGGTRKLNRSVEGEGT